MRLRRSIGVVLLVGVLLGIGAGPAQATKRITEYPTPTTPSEPTGVTSGPDGNLWFTEYWGNNIARITTEGAVTEYRIPAPGSFPLGIASGPDGNLWFTEAYGDNI